MHEGASQDNDSKILYLENYEYRMGQPMELTLQKNIKWNGQLTGWVKPVKTIQIQHFPVYDPVL